MPTWDEEEQDIFRKSSRLHFHLPFNGVEHEDMIEIDCEYVESLPIVQGYYYLRIPLLFYDWELKTSTLEEGDENTMLPGQHCRMLSNETNFERRVKVHCRINHSNSMKVQVMYFSLFFFTLFMYASLFVLFAFFFLICILLYICVY